MKKEKLRDDRKENNIMKIINAEVIASLPLSKDRKVDIRSFERAVSQLPP